MSTKQTEVLMIGVIGGLLILAMIPTEKLGLTSKNRSAVDGSIEAPSSEKEAPLEKSPSPTAPSKGSDKNRSIGEAGLFPIVPGAEWRYRVIGSEKIVSSDRWTQHVVSIPEGDAPGVVEVGFNGTRTQAHLFEDQGAIRFNGLPFTEPLEIEKATHTFMEGELVPQQARAVEGAVWTLRTTSRIVHKYTDKKGIQREQTAQAVQKDRARAGKFEPVIVPAGKYNALRVQWLSRIAIKSKGRPVLERLTAEPYRRETMWLSPGVGIVKRNVEYIRDDRVKHRVVLELLSYRPGPVRQ